MSPDWPIETERLTLRPFEEGDLDALFAMQSNPEVARYLYNEPRTLDETRPYLARKIAGASLDAEGDWLSCAAVERASGVVVADIALHWQSAEHKAAELGYISDPRHQGKGYATEASCAIVDWAFAQGFHRVIGHTEARNTASARVLEKLGMRREAHFVENEWVKGEWQSGFVYAILEHEWC